MAPGRRVSHRGGEGSSPASLLLAKKDWEVERKRPRAGKPKHTREAAVFWTDLVGASSEAGEAAKKEGYNTQRHYVWGVWVGFRHHNRQLGLLLSFGEGQGNPRLWQAIRRACVNSPELIRGLRFRLLCREWPHTPWTVQIAKLSAANQLRRFHWFQESFPRLKKGRLTHVLIPFHGARHLLYLMQTVTTPLWMTSCPETPVSQDRVLLGWIFLTGCVIQIKPEWYDKHGCPKTDVSSEASAPHFPKSCINNLEASKFHHVQIWCWAAKPK